MIILDYSQIMIANIMMSVSKDKNPIAEFDEGMIRHMLLNAIRAFRVKFGLEYGEIVLACDHTNVWRKNSFPYYKANRKKTTDTKIDWNSLYKILNKIRDEVKNNFPYKVIHIETAEGDDVIGSLVHEYGRDLNTGEKILIISTDKDFFQLHKYANVFQYDPVFKKKMITHNDPESFLKEHIIRGDVGDGIPNILSDYDSFVLNKRQKRLTEGRMNMLMNKDWENNPDRNYHRNQQLIDLSFTPKDLKKRILDEYHKEPIGNRGMLMNYFTQNKLKNLMKDIGEY